MIVIGVILAVGSATASSPEDPEASVGGSVSGTVLGAPLNTPAVGVEIRVFDQNNSLYDVAETGVDGTYSTVALPTGTYFALTYNWSGFLDELYSDLPCYSGCDPSGGNPISIDGSSVSDIDFLLDPGGRITGFVVDQLDDPVTGAEVKIFDQTGAVRAWSTSSADGGFATDTSRGLSTGSYFATASKLGCGSVLFEDLPCNPDCDPVSGTPIGVTPGLESGPVILRLSGTCLCFVDGFETGDTERWSATIP